MDRLLHFVSGGWRKGRMHIMARMNRTLGMVGLTLGLLLFLGAGCGSSISAYQAPNGAILAWDANSESDLAGYRVYHGLTQGEYDTSEDVGLTSDPTSPQYTLADLTVGEEYFFVVTAYDFYGNESEYSNIVSVTVTE